MDIEIEGLRFLMANMSQKRHEERMNIFISRAKNQRSMRRQMTEGDGRSKASGALQHKIWRPGELKMTKTEQHDEMDDHLHNKVWDPGILTIEGCDEEVIFFSFWGV